MRKAWLLFSQTVTIAVALLFVVATLKPAWLKRGPEPTVAAAPAPARAAAGAGAERLADRPRHGGDELRRRRQAGLAGGRQHHRQPRRRSGRATTIRCSASSSATARARRREERQVGLGSGVIVSPDGLPAHQQPRHRRRRRHRGHARRRPQRARASSIGTDPESDIAVLKIDLDKLPVLAFGDVDHAAGRRRRARDRQPVRRRPDGDLGHRQRARPQRARHQHLRELHPDRRRDQPRQLGRRAGRRRRQPARHQHRDLLAHRRQPRHRLRDPGHAPRAR